MHVLHLVQIYWPVPSGAARYFIEVGERLVAEGHRVTVISTDAFDLEHFWMPGKRTVAEPTGEHNGVQIVRLPVQRAPGPAITYRIVRRLMLELGRFGRVSLPALNRLATFAPRLPTLDHYLRTTPALADVDLVHSANLTLDFAIIPLARWAQQRTIPHLCTPFVHLGEPENQKIVRYYTMPHQVELLRTAAGVATMTDLERDDLIARGVPASKVHTVGAGVNPAELAGGDAERFRAEHNIRGPIVLSVGTAAYDKGTVHVLEAMRRLWAQGVEATWVQCGPLMGHFAEHYERLPAAERAHTRVLGYVSAQVRHDALAAADIYAQPSRTDSFGITYLEAWCYGVPVVGARAGGVPAVIADGRDGLLVRFGDVAGLADTLHALIRDPARRQALGAAGRAKVLRDLTWDSAYTRIRRLYAHALPKMTLHSSNA
jgi:glycosyltransferase involved in cell wall biosynthesis